MYNNANLKEDKYFHPVSVVPGPLAPSCAEGNGGNTTDILRYHTSTTSGNMVGTIMFAVNHTSTTSGYGWYNNVCLAQNSDID